MIPIQKIYNDTLKCSEISNDIIISNNEAKFIIKIGNTPNTYELIIKHNEITTTYLEINDDNTYHRTKLIHKFKDVIDENWEKDIYEKLNPLIVIRRDNKLKDILTGR